MLRLNRGCMQKLVTVYMDNYGGEGTLGVSKIKGHGHLEECLPQYLNDGWRVVQMTSFGGETRYGGFSGVAGFLTVLLEKA